MMNEPQHLLCVGNKLGETPIWAPEEEALYWVDWGGRPTCRYSTITKKLTTFPVAKPVTALARRSAGGWIAITQNGLYTWNPANNEYNQIYGLPKPEKPEICYNDAAVDKQGRLLVGTVDMEDPFRPVGSLFRLDIDGTLHELDTGYATANGIGLSPNGETIYVADQRHNQIISLDYDPENGTVYNRRLFASVPSDQGMPDGIVVDSEGFVWNGHWAGWRLTRYDPEGKIERQIRFPVEHVISFAFGGSDLDQLFITTAWWGYTDEERQRMPMAGDLFSMMTDVQGLIESAFAG